MKLVKRLARLGYGSRREVSRLIRSGAVTDEAGNRLGEDDATPHAKIRLHGEVLDPDHPLVLVLHKPTGYTCSSDDPGATIYDLLPPRFASRNPGLNPAGRLDKDTTGMLIMTDDGNLLHRLIHPKSHCPKVYRVSLDRPLEGHEQSLFASGELLLKGEERPLLPAALEVTGEREAFVTLTEGRYHQVRRMFAAAGNHVVALKRVAIGSLALPPGLDEGDWMPLSSDEVDSIFG